MTCGVSIFMCHGGVRWILVMFDVCDESFDDIRCWIVIYWICVCCSFFMPILEAPQPGRQTKYAKNI
jgi:hypothetical protein